MGYKKYGLDAHFSIQYTKYVSIYPIICKILGADPHTNTFWSLGSISKTSAVPLQTDHLTAVTKQRFPRLPQKHTETFTLDICL